MARRRPGLTASCSPPLAPIQEKQTWRGEGAGGAQGSAEAPAFRRLHRPRTPPWPLAGMQSARAKPCETPQPGKGSQPPPQRHAPNGCSSLKVLVLAMAAVHVRSTAVSRAPATGGFKRSPVQSRTGFLPQVHLAGCVEICKCCATQTPRNPPPCHDAGAAQAEVLHRHRHLADDGACCLQRQQQDFWPASAIGRP